MQMGISLKTPEEKYNFLLSESCDTYSVETPQLDVLS